MTQETVDKMLGEYMETMARIKHLETKEMALRKLAANEADVTAGDLISITQSWSTDPHGTPVTYQTENAAIALADMEPQRRSEAILAEAEKVRKVIESLYITCRYVEAWLSVLNPKEKIVVTCKAVQHLFWRETGVYMEREFGVTYSAVGLKRIYHHAMEKIYRLAEQ